MRSSPQAQVQNRCHRPIEKLYIFKGAAVVVNARVVVVVVVVAVVVVAATVVVAAMVVVAVVAPAHCLFFGKATRTRTPNACDAQHRSLWKGSARPRSPIRYNPTHGDAQILRDFNQLARCWHRPGVVVGICVVPKTLQLLRNSCARSRHQSSERTTADSNAS